MKRFKCFCEVTPKHKDYLECVRSRDNIIERLTAQVNSMLAGRDSAHVKCICGRVLSKAGGGYFCPFCLVDAAKGKIGQ